MMTNRSIIGSDGRKIELLESLGNGKNGVVYQAQYTVRRSGEAEFIAVKELFRNTPFAEAKLKEEARAMTALSTELGQHPNILKLYDFFLYPPDDLAGAKLYLVMEYAELKPLEEYKDLTRDEVLHILVQICNGLAFAHEHGIIHKDIKPENILIGRNPGTIPEVKVTDFGQAFVPQAAGGAGFGLKGTVQYTAPELLKGEAGDTSCDVYSVGALGYQLLTGQPYLAFTGDKLKDEELVKNRTGDVISPDKLPGLKLPIKPALGAAIVKALKVRPEDRYPSAAEMLLDLQNILSPLPAPRVQPVTFLGDINLFLDANTSRTTKPYSVPPLPPQGIFGRDELIGQLSEKLLLKEEAATNVPPLALYGMGGIGKTTLATALGRTDFIATSFPDGVLWVEVGKEPKIRPLLGRWGSELHLDLNPCRDEKECMAKLQSVLYKQKVLIIVDDLWKEVDGTYFNVGGPYCRTLFTTREPEIAFGLATRQRSLPVNLLSPKAALALLTSLVPEVTAKYADRAEKLCQKLEYLPLALTLAGRYLAIKAEESTRLDLEIERLLEKREIRLNLSDSQGRNYLTPGQPASLWDILGRSIDELNPQERERFMMCGIFGGEPISWDILAVASVWDCTVEEAETTVSRFVRRGLVSLRGERYWMHALLADYAYVLLEKSGMLNLASERHALYYLSLSTRGSIWQK